MWILLVILLILAIAFLIFEFDIRQKIEGPGHLQENTEIMDWKGAYAESSGKKSLRDYSDAVALFALLFVSSDSACSESAGAKPSLRPRCSYNS